MASPSPTSLDESDASTLERTLMARFPWMKRHTAFVRRCISWQAAVSPRPNFYFRWHLPRLVATLELLERAVQLGAVRVLDVATFAPYGLMLEERFADSSPTMSWSRTSYSGEPEAFEYDGSRLVCETVQVDLDAGQLPFPGGAFDLVLFTETIEHMKDHPQQMLVEMNRVLAPNGFLLVTTPNVASWKKVFGLSDGDWDYDSPTFGGNWGHRFEYSPYHLREMLRASGFSPVVERYRDVYFNDPGGVSALVEAAGVLVGKVLTGKFRQAVKFARRRGSGIFFLYRKTAEVSQLDPADRVSI